MRSLDRLVRRSKSLCFALMSVPGEEEEKDELAISDGERDTKVASGRPRLTSAARWCSRTRLEGTGVRWSVPIQPRSGMKKESRSGIVRRKEERASKQETNFRRLSGLRDLQGLTLLQSSELGCMLCGDSLSEEVRTISDMKGKRRGAINLRPIRPSCPRELPRPLPSRKPASKREHRARPSAQPPW